MFKKITKQFAIYFVIKFFARFYKKAILQNTGWPQSMQYLIFRIIYTLKRKCMISPSCTTYSFPSMAILPASRQAASVRYFT